MKINADLTESSLNWAVEQIVECARENKDEPYFGLRGPYHAVLVVNPFQFKEAEIILKRKGWAHVHVEKSLALEEDEWFLRWGKYIIFSEGA